MKKKNFARPPISKAVRFFILSFLLTVVFATGCHGIQELDRISIVTGVSIDKADKPGSIELTVQVAKADAVAGKGGAAPSEKSATMLLESTDTDVLGALNKLRRDNSRMLFLHHNQVIIFGKSIAESGLHPYLDSFMRNHEARMDIQVLVADSNADEILGTEMELEKISAVGIRRMLKNKTQISESFGTSFLTLISKLMETTTAPVIPIIKIAEEEDAKRLSLSGFAVFRGDKMVGELTEEQARGLAWLMGEFKSGVLSFETEQGNAELDIIGSSSKLEPVFTSGGKLTLTAKIQGMFNIDELKGFEGINLEKTMDLLSKGAQKEIRNLVVSCFDLTQGLNADIYGLGEYIHRHYPDMWKGLKDRWDEIYPSIELTPQIKVKIKDTGRIGHSPKFEER